MMKANGLQAAPSVNSGNGAGTMTVDELVLSREASNFDDLAANPSEDSLDFTGPMVANVREFNILKPGMYPFTVTQVTRRFYEPRKVGKLPPCWMLEITLAVDGGNQGTAYVNHRLYWHRTMQWKISEFWVAVGLVKPGEEFVPNPGDLVGLEGMCQLLTHEVDHLHGEPTVYHEVKHCYPKR